MQQSFTDPAAWTLDVVVPSSSGTGSSSGSGSGSSGSGSTGSSTVDCASITNQMDSLAATIISNSNQMDALETEYPNTFLNNSTFQELDAQQNLLIPEYTALENQLIQAQNGGQCLGYNPTPIG